MIRKSIQLLVILALTALSLGNTWAAVPETLNYSGYLSTDSGPVTGYIDVLFELYNSESGGMVVWSESHPSTVEDGYFHVALGDLNPIADTFDGAQYWLQVSVDGELMLPRSSVVSVPYALLAADAQTVGGLAVDQLVASSSAVELPYENGTSGLAATDVQGALDELRAALVTQQAALDAQQAMLQTQQTLLQTQQAALDAQQTTIVVQQTTLDTQQLAIGALTADNASLRTDLNTAAVDINNLESLTGSMASMATSQGNRISAVEVKTASMQVDDPRHVYFEGVNVHIVNGTNSTDGTTNALGNLIVGYNESPMFTLMSGSHNIIVGMNNSHTSYGGILVGSGHKQRAPFSSLIGGADNTTNASYSAIVGGQSNVADGTYGAVTGGMSNNAWGSHSSVSGGFTDVTTGLYSHISGGSNNTALGDYSTVGGGRNRIALSDYTWTAGGLTQSQ